MRDIRDAFASCWQKYLTTMPYTLTWKAPSARSMGGASESTSREGESAYV